VGSITELGLRDLPATTSKPAFERHGRKGAFEFINPTSPPWALAKLTVVSERMAARAQGAIRQESKAERGRQALPKIRTRGCAGRPGLPRQARRGVPPKRAPPARAASTFCCHGTGPDGGRRPEDHEIIDTCRLIENGPRSIQSRKGRLARILGNGRSRGAGHGIELFIEAARASHPMGNGLLPGPRRSTIDAGKRGTMIRL